MLEEAEVELIVQVQVVQVELAEVELVVSFDSILTDKEKRLINGAY